ncbi:HNH endonuclease [Vibrio parahaemolyticus]|uniref:HNH endonuclease n=1 Tax=Vibrio parahaemolyticus TaxID=670 RepID=UPI0015DF368E|nr:HNH endonuclease [Vibrio parahaemolyticus]EHR6781030.1 hypothetical protein [Vibrio parahaemolyticus]HCG9147349.1 hypothetical protein [Vibrio parahaemolyticus]HCG9641693.1 hypothetical protein [Vibrio parahaemolyticus]
MTCFLCNKQFSEVGNSEEHIILNALGGIKKVRDFICVKCNNSTGGTWDSEVTNTLELFSLIFPVQRGRKKVSPKRLTSIDNQDFYLHQDKIVLNECSYDIKNGKLRLYGPSRERIKQFRKKLEKNGEIPNNLGVPRYEDDVMGEYTEVTFKQKIELPPVDSDFSKSVVKSALALLSHENKAALHDCDIAKDFLRDSINDCVSYNYDIDVIPNRPYGVPFHSIVVFSSGNSIEAYIEFFGFVRYKLILSKSYVGDHFLYQYSLDPTSKRELNLYIELNRKRILDLKPWKLLSEILEDREYIRLFYDEVQRILNNIKDKGVRLNKYYKFQKHFTKPLRDFVMKNQPSKNIRAYHFLIQKTEDISHALIVKKKL